MRRKFHGGSTRDDSRREMSPVRANRDLCSPFSRVNEFPLLPLCIASLTSFLFFRRKRRESVDVGGKR